MKIRKYQGKTEKEAILAVKEELGSDALIVSVKHIRPRGIFRIFRKPFVEVTAAIDDRTVFNEKSLPKINLDVNKIKRNQDIIEKEPNHSSESEIDEFKRFIEKFSNKQKEKQTTNKRVVDSIIESIEVDGRQSVEILNNYTYENDQKLINKEISIKEESIEDTPMLKLIYEQLINNEIDELYANELMKGLAEYIIENNPDIDDVVSIVYRRIIKNLSDYDIITITKTPTIVFFIGPTGVGKTTTIAKIASMHSLNLNHKVALITSDTFRIAAVEQLRTYANILGIPIKVVYTKEEILEAIEFFSDKDLILIDTAGRSHKNSEHQEELRELLEAVEVKDVFLTLSVATKYKDLLKIVDTYDTMTNFKVIFTKLDETQSYGNIFNIKMATGAKLSYITFGQNVPDDISEINPHEIAKNLLGGDDDGSSEWS